MENKEKKLYMVLRLNRDVELTDVMGGTHIVDITNKTVAGLVPVFKTKKAATINSQKWKYSIIEITAKDVTDNSRKN